MSEYTPPQRADEVISRNSACIGIDVNSLHADIFHLLSRYLAREEFQAFLHVNKHVHDEYIGYRLISLNKRYSLLYVENEPFREKISSLILDPGRQLALCLSFCSNITDVSALGRVHSLNLSFCSSITDVSALGGVHTLNLSGCSSITDVSALGGVHTFNVSGGSVSALGGVHTLNLSGCSSITDVSALGGMHTLDLSDCSKITDVSALGGVHTLDLSGCSSQYHRCECTAWRAYIVWIFFDP